MTVWDTLRTLLVGYPPPPEMIDPRFPELLQKIGGLSLTFIIAVFSMVIGTVLGCALALCRRESRGNISPALRFVMKAVHFSAAAVVETVRGVPVLLLALLFFHLPYRLTGLRFPGVVLAIATFSLYAGVYFSELIRSGFRAFPPGLREAGLTLGLRPGRIFLKIELPLVLRNMLPDVVNLAVTVFKDTSILAAVALAELTYTGRQMFMSQPLNYGLILILTLFLYWAPAAMVSALLVVRSDGGTSFRKRSRPSGNFL